VDQVRRGSLEVALTTSPPGEGVNSDGRCILIHMVRKQIYIDEALDRGLKSLAARTGDPEVVHVRAALREYLGEHADVSSTQGGSDPLLQLVGLVDDPELPDDIAEEHDHYPSWGRLATCS